MDKIAEDFEEALNLQEKYDDKPHGFMQLKGTDLCMDLRCKCGQPSHIDSDFAYVIECPYCHAQYMVNGHVELIELKADPGAAKICDPTGDAHPPHKYVGQEVGDHIKSVVESCGFKILEFQSSFTADFIRMDLAAEREEEPEQE